MTEGIQAPQTQPRQPSVWGWIGGLMISLLLGGAANIIAGLLGMATNNHFFGFMVGTVPGVGFIILGLLVRRARDWSGGFLIGGCIVALIGGACAASMVGTSFH